MNFMKRTVGTCKNEEIMMEVQISQMTELMERCGRNWNECPDSILKNIKTC
jgi:hypothetical protein